MQVFIENLGDKHNYQSTRLMLILRAIQARYYCIPEAAIEQLSGLLNIPSTQIKGVIEFYSFFISIRASI